MLNIIKVVKIVFIFSLAIMFFGLSSAADYDHIISNSDNWRDVYSIVHFANLNGVDSDFLVSTNHGPLLLGGLSKSKRYLVISSNSRSYVINYPGLMSSSGFDSVDELNVNNANLDLVEELEDINDFVVVGNDYGYYAVSAVSYAVVNRAWVFFADRNNIDEIDNIIGGRDVGEVLIYGNVDREVSQTLEKYNPVTINSGDRFQDNTELVDKYFQINPTKQIILTNGEFIEKEIMSGIEPILFTGKENVPDKIRDYLTGSDIEIGVLIGGDLVGAATNIRRSTGISVIAKFARGARRNTGAIANVEGLDLFYLPTPIVDLKLYSARYNKASNQLEITYKSDSNVPIYFKGTINYEDEDGSKRIGDANAIFISPNDYKTVIYDNVVVRENNLTIDIFTLYGDSVNSLDKILEARIDAEIVDVIDGCEIDLLSLSYSKRKNEFGVVVKNIGAVDCYADVELIDVMVDGDKTTIGVSGAEEVKSGKKTKLTIPFEMTEEDILENEFVNVHVYYGEREDNLVKLIKGKLRLDIEGVMFMIILIIAALVIIALIILLFIVWRRRRDEEI
jgi:hypothetical protein